MNNRSLRQLEHEKEQSSVILQAIATNGDPIKACANLIQFIQLHLLDDDAAQTIGDCVKNVQYTPVLGIPQQPTAPPLPLQTVNTSAKPIPRRPAIQTSPSLSPQMIFSQLLAQGSAQPADSLTADAQATVRNLIENYRAASNHKAMVVSDGGHNGHFVGMPTVEIAVEKATTACQTFADSHDPCRLVYVDDQKVGHW